MSRSPERISSYRRHFEDISSSSSYQVRVSSPSPTRRDNRHMSAGYSRSAGVGSMQADTLGRRNVSTSRNVHMSSGNAGTVACVGYGNGTPIDLDASAAENKEFLSTRSSERQEMIVLNDRLAVYIEKVRSLEQQNKLLETEIEAIQNRFVKPSGLRQLYEEQLRDLKKIAEAMRIQRNQAIARKETMAGQLGMIKVKYEEAVELKRKAELEIEAFRPDVDRATSQRIALEKQLEQVELEIEFLKRVHKAEIEELLKMIYAAHATAQSSFELPDLSSALKQIQAQYDDIAAKNLKEMDTWYKSKFEDLNNKTTKHVDMVRNVREEVTAAKKDIVNKERGLEALKTKNEALEVQIREAQEKYKKELEALQERIETLKEELKSTKSKIAVHLREYQNLLNMKMALEIEITTYRKLIEGEDLRLTTMVGSMSIMSGSLSSMSTGMSMAAGMGLGCNGGGIGGAGGMGGGMSFVGMGAGGVGAGGVGAGGEQAVEMTERRTVLIRTVKAEDESMERDTKEQTYIISGAANDSDQE
ncbi:hypothetical protein UPYG_G00144870 [Umbra pygmaea]|uniref:IF rod domain-containing protein n=1 Tax=Umbra pygmaea TaxID=75934 RepID=A0ABD0WXE0_UMBPY